MMAVFIVSLVCVTGTSKNLDVKTYRNGDAIPQVQDFNEWKNLRTGAPEASTLSVMGFLYVV